MYLTLSSTKSSDHLICTLTSLLRTFTKLSPWLVLSLHPLPASQIFFKNLLHEIRCDTSTLKSLEMENLQPQITQICYLMDLTNKSQRTETVTTSSTTKSEH